MTVQTSAGRTIHIHFVHSTHDGATRPDAGPVRQALDHDAKLLGRRLTQCELSEVSFSGTSGGETTENYMILGQGVSICHPKDVFSKANGRKKSLGKAMQAAGFSPVERESVWKAYLTQFAPKPAKQEQSSRS